MSAADELYPPVQYGGGWMLLALGIIALLSLLAWILILLTRPRRDRPASNGEQAVPTADVLTLLRQEYLARIQQIETDYRAGALSPRHANLELSRVVRAFVNEY